MVLPVIALTDRVLPGMRERGWGRILTSTSSGALSPIPNLGLSNTLRASLHAWSKTLADEVGRDGITSNVIVPGRIETDRTRFLDERRAEREDRSVDDVMRDSAATMALGRYGRPDEYADVAAFLCSDSASYITGSVVRVDGGLIRRASPDAGSAPRNARSTTTHRLRRTGRRPPRPGRPRAARRTLRPVVSVGGRALDALAAAVAAGVPDDDCVDPDAPVLAPWTRPRKILGIGLNYGAHAGDLGEQAPRTSPASFIKGDHTIVGPGEPIIVPPGIGKVTAEAELGLVIGRTCFRVGVDEAMSFVAGVVPVLDQTAEAVLMENPRYLTRVKNYPTFFSFGPDLITLDEVLAHAPLEDLRVATVHNGAVHRKDTVAGMTFSPAELLSFHSQVMPFYPGDILSTGTPGRGRYRGGRRGAMRAGRRAGVADQPGAVDATA